MHRAYQSPVDKLPVLPEVARIDRGHGGGGVEVIARLEHATTKAWRELPGRSDLSVVECMNRGIPPGVVQYCHRSQSGPSALQFAVDHQTVTRRVQHLSERWNGLSLDTEQHQLLVGQRGDSSSDEPAVRCVVWDGIVMNE